MRNDKHKLSLPPKLKTIPRGLLAAEFSSQHSEKGNNFIECDPIFMNKSRSAFDSASFKTKYERALDLIANNKENDSRNALSILQFLCDQIQRMPEENQLSYELLENVVINCWRLKNTLKDESKRQQSLNFIRIYVHFFADIYKRNQIRKNGLHMLYLIQANEQFDEKLFNDALKSCEMSIKYCSGIKNQAHLLKVQYLKCSIYNSLNNVREEQESIKRCLFFINSLIATTTEEGLKQYINQLKKSLVARETYLKQNPHNQNQKSVDISKKTSFSVFRRRSLSHKKQNSQKQIIIEKKTQMSSLKNSKRPMVKSIHTRSYSGSKHTINIKEEKITFLPADLTRFNKPELKLKKKPLKITDKNRLYEQYSDQRNNPMDDIQEISPATFNYQLLMVRRPNQVKKEFLKKSNKKPEVQQKSEQLSMQEILSKKESAQQQQDKIEPVTHYISKATHNGHDEIMEDQYEEMVRECVKNSEEALLKTFFKKMALDEQNKFNDKTLHNISIHHSRIGSDSSSSFSSQNQFNRKTEDFLPELSFNRTETNNHYQFYQPQLDGDSNFNLNENLQLITYMGILSNFKFSIKIQKKERMDQAEQLYKELFIKISTILNKQHNVHTTISFRYYNPFQKNLQIILDDIFEQELQEKFFIGQTIKHKLLCLISNRLFFARKPIGISLVQKQVFLLNKNKDSIIEEYSQHLKTKFIIYQQNKLTNLVKPKLTSLAEIIVKKNKQNGVRQQLQDNPKDKKQELNGYHQILNFYLPQLIRRMTDDFRQQKSSLSSMRRMKSEKFYKDTILSYRSLIKSLNQSDTNARAMFDDQKSLSIVMPSDFNSKISNFFQHQQGVKETSIYEFYYCMKFILIQPSKSEYFECLPEISQNKQRRSTIQRQIKQIEKEPELCKPRFLEDTLQNFYDFLEIKHLFHLNSKQQVHIKMTCYKVKQIFKKTEEYFYKFQMQFNRQKIKMMKFISTSYDIYLLVNRRTYQLKSSRKKQKAIKQDYDIPAFNKGALLNLLKEISKRIFVKKDYIYSNIGLETPNSHFNYINKFRLQGKTVQNKQFMIPHLKCIHILLQKSIKIICDHFRQYAVLTIRQIERSVEFNIIFYLPRYQRTYSVNLSRKIINYLQIEHKLVLFENGHIPKNQEISKILFQISGDSSIRNEQIKRWNIFSRLFKFEAQYYEDKIHLLLRIGNYVAFLKDSCFSQFFQLKDKIFHLQMSLARKSTLNASQNLLNHVRNIHPKRKSASSKQLIKRNNFLTTKDMKSSGRPMKPSIQKKVSNDDEIFKKGDLFEKLSKIYQTQTSKYIIYLSLTKIYEISDEQGRQAQQTRRVNFSFYLSDMINLLKESKKELYTKEQKIYNEFNQEIFSFSILLRSMTIIKYKLINELKLFKDIDNIFEGNHIISIQKQFKNNLIKAFNSQNQNLYSLNASKKLYRLDNNIFLINKQLMNGKKNAIVSIFYDEKGKKITFYLTNISDLFNKQKMYTIRQMKFPWIEFYQKDQLFKISTRIYNYYKNILIFT